MKNFFVPKNRAIVLLLMFLLLQCQFGKTNRPAGNKKKTEKNTVQKTDTGFYEPEDKYYSNCKAGKMLDVQTYKGYIGDYPVTMVLVYFYTLHCYRKGAKVKGFYYYDRQGPDHLRYISGYHCGSYIEYKEFDAKGQQTGAFEGQEFTDNADMAGTWTGRKQTLKWRVNEFKL